NEASVSESSGHARQRRDVLGHEIVLTSERYGAKLGTAHADKGLTTEEPAVLSEFPVCMLKPFSSTKIALRPPPRSSAPRNPNRVPLMFPLVACTNAPDEPLFETLLVYMMPASRMPYSVAELCAWTAEAANAAEVARVRGIFFMKRLQRVLNVREAAEQVQEGAWLTKSFQDRRVI